jgi:5-methylthioribose kinase
MLLAGVVGNDIAQRLGQVLACWHLATAHRPDLNEDFGDTEIFRQLRVDPFYFWVAGQHREFAAKIESIVERMTSTRSCLVHGDFSPKNVLVGPSGLWVIDWEVAHLGDPVFDIALMITHLICKALHRQADFAALRAAADAFLGSYEQCISSSAPEIDQDYLTDQVACLVLARIDGKSPASYLNTAAREKGRMIARDVLTRGPVKWAELWALVR